MILFTNGPMMKWSVTLLSLGHLQPPQVEKVTGACSAKAQPGFIQTISRLLVPCIESIILKPAGPLVFIYRS
jgi:hypothetical protein